MVSGYDPEETNRQQERPAVVDAQRVPAIRQPFWRRRCVFGVVVVIALVGIIVGVIFGVRDGGSEGGGEAGNTRTQQGGSTLISPSSAPSASLPSISPMPSALPSISPYPSMSPNPSTSPMPTQVCTTNLNDVISVQNRAIEEGTLHETRTIVLCPNSEITSNFATGNFFYIFTPNMHVKCGEDGSSRNNCVVVGRQDQPVIVWLAPGFDVVFNYGLGEVRLLDNIVFSGVTFTGLEWSFDPSSNTGVLAVWLAVPGSVTFTDCHWRDNLAQRIILTEVRATPDDNTSSRRHLFSEDQEEVQLLAPQNHQRTLGRSEAQHRLQTDYTMEAVFDSCNFTRNILSEAVVTIFGQEAEVYVRNVFFYGNNLEESGMGHPEGGGFTSLIELGFEGHLEVFDSVFTNNSVDPAPVTVDNATFFAENNVFANNGANLSCDAFLVVAENSTFYADNSTWRDAAYECVMEVPLS